MIEIVKSIESSARQVTDKISAILENSDRDLALLYESMRYSACGGGKRIRPFLARAVAQMLSGEESDCALRFAVAVEMIHTYSLIHDDLPCMDNDDFRRGEPTNHKVFGVAEALLAGDALLTGAFEVISKTECDDAIKVRAISTLSEAAGACGMIGGQMIDIKSEGKSIEFDLLLKMHSLKTGALIRSAARLGAISAGCVDPVLLEKIDIYAKNVGLAFQIEDDVLDAAEENDGAGCEDEVKTTFMSFMTADEAMSYAMRLTDEAKSAISDIPNSEILIALADHLLVRKV